MVKKNFSRKDLSEKIYKKIGFSKNFSLDIVDDSLETALDAVWPWLDHVHLHDLAGQGYPYRELFRRLCQRGYAGFLSAEAARSVDNPPGDLPMFVAYYGELLRAFVDLGRA